MPDANAPRRVLIFTGFSGFTQRLDRVARLLQDRHGVEIDCLVFGRDNHAYLKDRPAARYRSLVCVEDLLEACADAPVPDAETLKDIEAALGQSLTHIAYSERTFVQHTHALPMLRPLSQDEIAAHVASLHDALKPMVDKVDAVLAYTCASIHSELLYYLCRQSDTPFWTLNEQRAGFRWSVVDNNVDHHEAAMALYRDPSFSATDAGRARFEAYRAKVGGDRRKPSEMAYQRKVLSRKRLSPANLGRFLRNFIAGKHQDQYYLARNKWQHLKYLFEFKLRQRFATNNLENNLPVKKFIYFPLALIPEASTLIRGLSYYDQLSLIKSLSLELPLDWVLLVREHPSAIGQTPIGFYEEAARIFNVRLVSPFVSPIECIRKAEAVVTVAGTTAFESLALGKRTIVLGQAIFDSLESVHHVSAPSEIGPLLRRPWSAQDANAQAEDLCRFISALESSPGFDDSEDVIWTQRAFASEELPLDRAIADAIEATVWNATPNPA